MGSQKWETRAFRPSVDPNNPPCEFMTQYKYGDGEKNYGPRGQVRIYMCIYVCTR